MEADEFDRRFDEGDVTDVLDQTAARRPGQEAHLRQGRASSEVAIG
jgi:hypothetical protein